MTCYASRCHSELRRLEQQVRWAGAKAATLSEARGVPASSLLLLRSTRRTLAVAAQYASVLSAAYPARHEDLRAALAGDAPWPGDGLMWCRVEGGAAEILDRPPRGVQLGR